ncbi:iron ABC transporter permease [Phyllobacterium sp. 21LDTY02-6]|uniref:FecCD family ABC transporter permease n=1 Tax=Phyllobacterium sp. 21LDTY02-6 TaxID=2944903 RepID=UPI002021D797|nr:iron chelate uptake ABC transporter family permease subunit [Phyllobacterium sp. 21LDTY02-6]MCO4319314.1 iron ABC transporter permease [Phyllobacterium sp. 21LDTY02-6]
MKPAVDWRRRVLASSAEGDRAVIARLSLIVLFVALVVIVLVSLASGASDASVTSVIASFFDTSGIASALSVRDRIIIWDIRLPRVVLASLIGAALAVSGAVMQGLFRNPLADPGIVGVSSGAGLGALSVIVLGNTLFAPVVLILGTFSLPIAAFACSLLFTLILYGVATRRGQTSIATMLLAGIALGAMATAYMGMLTYIADDRQLRDLNFWLLGSLAGASWSKILASGPFIAVALLVSPFLARGLNGMALGEAAANHLGIPVQRFKRIAIVTVAAATGASVAVSGTIGFVGVVVPHILRLVIGPDHRYLLPAAAMLGAILLLLADAVSRTIVAPAELPIGIITAAVGAPVFLWILLRRRGIVDL